MKPLARTYRTAVQQLRLQAALFSVFSLLLLKKPDDPVVDPEAEAAAKAAAAEKAKADAAAAKIAKKAKAEALAELAEETGMTPAALKKLAKDSKNASEAAKDETARALEAAQAAETAAAAALAKANQKAMATQVQAALVAAGADIKATARIAKMVDLEDDADEDDVKTAVDALAVEFPEMFSTEPKTPVAPGSVPKKTPTPDQSKLQSALDKGRAAYNKRHNIPEKQSA